MPKEEKASSMSRTEQREHRFPRDRRGMPSACFRQIAKLPLASIFTRKFETADSPDLSRPSVPRGRARRVQQAGHGKRRRALVLSIFSSPGGHQGPRPPPLFPTPR